MVVERAMPVFLGISLRMLLSLEEGVKFWSFWDFDAVGSLIGMVLTELEVERGEGLQ